MKTQNELGIITYKNYTENVIIDNNFDTQALYNIIDNDPDFVKFEIFKDGILVSTTETTETQPSEKVKALIIGINELNKKHNGGISGFWVNLLFGSRVTKEELQYIKKHIDPLKPQPKNEGWGSEGGYSGICLHG